MFSTDVCGGHAVNFSIDKTRADGASYIYNNKPEERAARMVLTIDIGNTNIVLGGYENGALGFCTRISTDKSLEADQYALELSGILNLYKVAGENIEGAIISSVVPQITDTVARALRMFAGVEPLKLTQELSLIHISEPTRQAEISYAVFCLKKKKTKKHITHKQKKKK